MSVSVLKKEEGCRKILAVFLPSFTSILLSPACGLRLLRARRGRGGDGQRPRCRFPLLLRTAQAAKGESVSAGEIR